MMSTFKKLHFTSFTMAFALSLFSTQVFAVATSNQFAKTPPAISSSSSTKPLAMLVMSNDNQLFYKAYNDWSDLDGDGQIESTYKHSFDYYGYFDSYKCYEYDVVDTRFEPKAITADKYCTGGNISYWSGNFLNWVSMTRMDIMRKVLYGGKRSTDTTSKTVLERAYLPSDAHSFAKFVDSGSISIGNLTPFPGGQDLTFCNTTYNPSTTEESQDTTLPPQLRVAKGDFRYWAANERWQCTWDTERGDNWNNNVGSNVPASAAGNDPDIGTDDASYSGIGPDFIVRVEVCDSSLIGKEKCNSYTSTFGTVNKPIGLLHTHGENENIKFGLLTGSYAKNKSGGVVRKDISLFTDELTTDGNGDFTGQFNTSVDGIVTSIDKMRISKYEYGSGYYNGSDSCPWGLTSFNDGDCSNWGNPASEMYLEAVRYFSGLSRNNAFSLNANDDTGYITGLTNVGGWTDPLSATNYCASCNIIMLNTSDFSYDDNDLDMSGLPGTPSATTLTNNIGVKEGISGNEWFVGENGDASPDQLCTAKTITNLGDVKGICPGSPRLQGTYNMAGVAHWAHTNDIRALTGAQKVNTYAVALAPAVPKIEIPVPGSTGKFVKILPACRNDSLSPKGNCAIVDFKVIVPHSETAGTGTGSFYVNWEDSEQGGDYDMDMKGNISYSITSTGITVATTVDFKAGSYPMGFGYVISGTTKDGFRVHSGTDNFPFTDPDGLNDCNPVCNVGDGTTTQAYTLGTSSANLLEDPLFYVAKWGGFTDLDGDNEPSNVLEYDSVINATGAVGSDGIPDNYFLSQNPTQIETQLNKVLSQIANRRSAGSAAAVITNTVTSTAMIVQGLYQPEITSADQTQTVQWGGYLHTLLLDKELNFREDSDQDGQLDNYATDKVVKFFYDKSQNRTRIARYNTSDGITLTLDSVAEIDDLKTLWDAKRELNEMDSTALTSNRTYTAANNLSTNTNSQRYIFTWLDTDNNGVVDAGEQSDFITSNFTNSNFGYFHLQADKDGDADIDLADAQQLVNFIRGVDYSTLRNRTIDYDDDGTDEVWRLGDIIHSSPAIVEKPSGIWRTQYGDTSYDAFTSQYASRRSVVYVGGNDGLLHAFNSGFVDASIKKYDLTRAQESYETAAPASHKLGAEIWAYAPKNLLPHLQWLSEVNYPNHVYFVDGELKTFDVNIFPADTDHPNGWGTILVATMRFGGGSDDSSNATSLAIDVDGDATTDFTARSSIIIMDITNPEKPPVLLAEYNDANTGLTLSTPELISFRQPASDGDWSNPNVNDWYLVFGSGPTDLSTLLSTQTPSLYTLKLNDIDTGTISVNKKTLSTANSYIGRPHTVDWTNNFMTDNVYFGVAGGTTAAPTGYLARMGTSSILEDDASYYDINANWATSVVINPSQPFVYKPTTVKSNGKNWVFAGSGRRLETNDDLFTPTQGYYGIKENISVTNGLPNATTFTKGASGSTLSANELQNVTGLQVFTNYTVLDPLNSLPSSPVISTFSQLEAYMNTVSGWYRDWATVSSLEERVNADTQTLSNILIITTFQPSIASCQTSGDTKFYSLYNITGTVHPGAGIGEKTSITNAGANMVTDYSSYNGENFGNLVCIGSKCGLVIQGSGDGGGDRDGDGILDAIDDSNNDGDGDGDNDNCTTSGGGACAEEREREPGAIGRQSWREILFEEEL